MELLINGEKGFFEQPLTIAALLAVREYDAKRVVVELNGGIVPRESYAGTSLREGDVLEVVHFVGGG